MWLYLTVPWVVSQALVSLIFTQNSNNSHPDDYGVDHLCRLWCLMVYLLFCIVDVLSFLLLEWYNHEIIPDGAVMMVILFSCGDFSISHLRSAVVRVKIPPWDMSQGVFTKTVYWDISLLGRSLGTQIFPVDVTGQGSNSVFMIIQV